VGFVVEAAFLDTVLFPFCGRSHHKQERKDGRHNHQISRARRDPSRATCLGRSRQGQLSKVCVVLVFGKARVPGTRGKSHDDREDRIELENEQAGSRFRDCDHVVSSAGRSRMSRPD
jgi:hypothetical protein